MSAVADPVPAAPPAPQAGWRDALFRLACEAAAGSVLVLAAALVAFLVTDSWPAVRAFGFRFFAGTNWDPVRDDYGALPFVYGTLATSAVAMVVAVPLGVGAAAFLAEVAPGWVRRVGSFLVELLAAIPSVVFGFWGLFVLAPAVQKVFDLAGGPNTGGAGILSAGLVLAVMVLPYITAVSHDALRAVPRSQREGALALGATRWQTIRSVVLPSARPGVIGGCFLALGRAIGETMAVTMLIGNHSRIDPSPFALGDSIASVIANQLGNTTRELHRAALVELGLTLLLVTAAVNALARVLIWRVGRPRGSGQWSVVSGQKKQPSSSLATGHRPLTTAQTVDRLMTAVLAGCLAIALGPLFLILGHIAYRGTAALDWSFFTHLPIDTPPGLGHALLGTGMLAGLATAFAVPVGILAAVHLAESHGSRLAAAVRFVGELLGGVPSIVVGIFGYAVLVRPIGFSGWAGSFALAVLMLPVVMRAAEEALRMVPNSLRDASYALGAARWQTVLRVTVPAARPAIATGVLLAVARIAGETAPLLLTANNSTFWPSSPSERTPFLTYYIYNYSRSDVPEEQRLAWAAALMLLALVVVLNAAVRLLTGRRAPRMV
jgi:phosphate transport system permease protein